MDTADAFGGLLAAAPQPPEAGCSVSNAETEDAPVQMPEPDAWRYTDARGHFRYRGRRVGFSAEYPMLKPEPLYTEQQVRHRLAAADAAAKAREMELLAVIEDLERLIPLINRWGTP